MFTVLSGILCYTPQPAGIQDIFICNDKIIKICGHGEQNAFYACSDVIQCDGLMAFPGLIDQHVHITGGGGEEGPASRIGEIAMEDIAMAGITTLVGLLGLDRYTKNLTGLYAKAKALEFGGLTTYIYTGSYSIPIMTLTGSIANDIILVDKVLGIGEIAISDKRSSDVGLQQFIELAAQCYTAGLIAGKPGIVHIHVGDGREGLSPLLDIVEHTELPKEIFVPTHINRKPELLREGIKYLKAGGNIDLTAGETIGTGVPEAIREILSKDPELTRVTVSSDGNGSSPTGVTQTGSLFADIKNGIQHLGIAPEKMFLPATENVARLLKLYPKKGVLHEGSDADILITDRQYNIQKLMSRGQMLVNDGKTVKGGGSV